MACKVSEIDVANNCSFNMVKFNLLNEIYRQRGRDQGTTVGKMKQLLGKTQGEKKHSVSTAVKSTITV